MNDKMLFALQISAIASRRVNYSSGVADGGDCRRQGTAPSSFLLVAMNDDYSEGFRAGYFLRAPALL
jgi:hypothetical protein